MPTKKDMILAAEIVKTYNTGAPKGMASPAQIAATAFAEYFAKSNPRFDRARFLKACGL